MISNKTRKLLVKITFLLRGQRVQKGRIIKYVGFIPTWCIKQNKDNLTRGHKKVEVV